MVVNFNNPTTDPRLHGSMKGITKRCAPPASGVGDFLREVPDVDDHRIVRDHHHQAFPALDRRLKAVLLQADASVDGRERLSAQQAA